jgi:hypothetical protein
VALWYGVVLCNQAASLCPEAPWVSELASGAMSWLEALSPEAR